jgi:hypothetical protein
MVEKQNRLSRIGDREIALSMMYMRDPDRNAILACLPRPKADRVREELVLHRRLRITYQDYLRAVELVSDSVSGTGGKRALGSYLRPRR